MNEHDGHHSHAQGHSGGHQGHHNHHAMMVADFAYALERMVTVMVITCPHALGLAVPLVVAVSTAIAAKNGLLIRDRSAFERARNVDAILFDKTGTLTEGRFGVTDIVASEGQREDELLMLAASLESQSEHPIAQGIVGAALMAVSTVVVAINARLLRLGDDPHSE